MGRDGRDYWWVRLPVELTLAWRLWGPGVRGRLEGLMILFAGVYVKGKEWVVRIKWIGRTELMHPKEERKKS